MISNIAVRQFPQMWPSYLEDMVSVCLAAANESSVSGEQEIAIMAIEFTASDSIDTDYCRCKSYHSKECCISCLEILFKVAFIEFNFNHLLYS